MNHNLRITLNETQNTDSIVLVRRVKLREKIIRLLFGQLNTVTLLIPGDTVDCVSVTEVPHD